jgi:hypothetical protein
MLTEKCPFCGSFNDVEAAACYFCHKDLPDTPGHKKKRGTKSPSDKQSIALPPSLSGPKRKSPPGCLIGLVVFLFLIAAVVVFQWVNGAYKLVEFRIPMPSSSVGNYITYLMGFMSTQIDKVLEFPVIILTSILMIAILCWGLLSLKPWARALALMLLIILLIANFALFVTFVMDFVYTPINGTNFLLILAGILLNGYLLLWFFERKKLFE